MDKVQKQLDRAAFELVHDDFERLRLNNKPIKVQLVHRASNAEAEGVHGLPRDMPSIAAFETIGCKEAFQRCDESGNPIFRSDPVLDVKGNPITNSSGEFFDVCMPVVRCVTFSGESDEFSSLRSTADRMGKLLRRSPDLPINQLLKGWVFNNPRDV